jgi:hypothetical protein
MMQLSRTLLQFGLSNAKPDVVARLTLGFTLCSPTYKGDGKCSADTT